MNHTGKTVSVYLIMAITLVFSFDQPPREKMVLYADTYAKATSEALSSLCICSVDMDKEYDGKTDT